jgi:hypothetical protein
MGSPACANPANINHVVRPAYEGGGKTWCFQECVCGQIVSGHGPNACGTAHPAHEECDCTITPAFCIDCDAEFLPTEAEQDQCPSCIEKESSHA